MRQTQGVFLKGTVGATGMDSGSQAGVVEPSDTVTQVAITHWGFAGAGGGH